MTQKNTLSLDGLEYVYDVLATAIDSTFEENQTELFLTKLCLLCAHHLGDEKQMEQLIQTALQDL